MLIPGTGMLSSSKISDFLFKHANCIEDPTTSDDEFDTGPQFSNRLINNKKSSAEHTVVIRYENILNWVRKAICIRVGLVDHDKVLR